MALDPTKPLSEEDLKRLASSQTFSMPPVGFGMGASKSTTEPMSYDTQTRKFVGSGNFPSRMPDQSMAMPDFAAKQPPIISSFQAPLPTFPSAAAVGQNLITQPQARNISLPSEVTQSTQSSVAAAATPTRKTPIQTPYGTVYATVGEGDQVGQIQNDRAFDGNTPFWRSGEMTPQSARLANIGEQAQRNAAITQMRQQGARTFQQGIQAQEQFFAQKREERQGLREAEGRALAMGVRPMDIMRARESTQPSSMAGIRKQALEYTQRLPMEGLERSAFTGFTAALPAGGSRPLPSGPMGPSGYALYEQQQAQRGAGGATVPYSNFRAEQRRRTRDIARSQGMQPAYSRPTQEKQEDYLRRRGLM
jgi:hypothetical protein